MKDEIKIGAVNIPMDLLEFKFIKSSGPGGQNVNKVATAVQLRFDVTKCLTITPQIFERLKSVAGRRMTKTGTIVITARRYRSQERNRDEAVLRFSKLFQNATNLGKVRRSTQPGKGVKTRRKNIKMIRSKIKVLRSPIHPKN